MAFFFLFFSNNTKNIKYINKLCVRNDILNWSEAMTYKIFIYTETKGTLVFKNVESYSEEGSFIRFTDSMTKRTLMYPISKAQIEVENHARTE